MGQVVNKIDFIRKSVRRGTVLDVGFLGHSAKGFKTCPLHKAIASKGVVGMDIEAWEMREAKLKVDYDGPIENEGWGSGWVGGDACQMPFKDKAFGTVVAGDLIEHLWDVGSFLDECKRLLKFKGRLILTTPNPFYIDNWLYAYLRNEPLVNPDHKNMMCPYMMYEALKWKGFEKVEIRWLKGSWNLMGFITHREARQYVHRQGGWVGKAWPGERHLLAILRALWRPLRWLLTLFSPLTRHSDYVVVCERR